MRMVCFTAGCYECEMPKDGKLAHPDMGQWGTKNICPNLIDYIAVLLEINSRGLIFAQYHEGGT